MANHVIEERVMEEGTFETCDREETAMEDRATEGGGLNDRDTYDYRLEVAGLCGMEFHGLQSILEAHGVEGGAAARWDREWWPAIESRSRDKRGALWNRCPCPPDTPPYIRRFLLAEFAGRSVLDEDDSASEFRSFPLDAFELPVDFSERVMFRLMELGESGLAVELLHHPVQFWLAYYNGWARAIVRATAYHTPTMEPWLADLVAAAKRCVSIAPAYSQYVSVQYDGANVELDDGYRFPAPELSAYVRLGSDTPRIWLCPMDFIEFGPLPLTLSVRWPGKTHVDIRRLVGLFEQVSAFDLTEAPFALTMDGKYCGHVVELAVLRGHWDAWHRP